MNCVIWKETMLYIKLSLSYVTYYYSNCDYYSFYLCKKINAALVLNLTHQISVIYAA